nr:copia protein [Tanacetum cinerariifolium]
MESMEKSAVKKPKSSQDAEFKTSNDVGKKVNEVTRQENECKDQKEKDSVNSTNRVIVVLSTVNTASNEVNAVDRKSSIELPDDPNMPELEDISIFKDSNEDVFGTEADLNNLESTFQVSPIPTTRIHKDHPLEQVIRDLHSAPQTRRISKNKLDERGIVIRNKARMVAQGYIQEECIDYDEVFAPVTRIEAIRLFLTYASFKDFVVYQMNVNSAFLYEKIKEEVYVRQPLGFEDPDFPDKVYKVKKALYGLRQSPRAWYETLSTYLLDNEFQKGKIDKTLFIKRHKGDILLFQVYVDDIIFDEDGIDYLLYTTMYPRFIKIFLDKQIDGLPTHKEKYDVLFHTKKIYANMKRISKGFSSKETPLFLRMVRPNQVQMSEGLAQPTNTQRTPTFDMPPLKPKKTQKPRQPKRKTTKVPQSSESTDITADEVVHKEGVTVCSGDGPRRQDTMGDTSAHTRYERVSKISSDSLLTGVNTPQIDENRLKHFELMKIYTILQKKVLDLGDELKRTKTAQQTKIDGLKRRVKKLEKKQRLRTHKLKRLYKVGFTTRVISSSDEALDKEDTSKQGSVDEIDTDENIALVITHDDMIIDVVVDVAQVTIAIADIPVSATETIVTTTLTINAESTTTNVEVTQAPKRKGDMIQEPEETTITKIASLQKPQVQDKDKAMKRIDTFVDFRTELVEESRKKDEAETTQESSSKKEGDELEQDRSKKQKVEDDKESEELKKCLEIILDDVTIDAIPLSSKSPTIVDYKIYTEGKKNYSKFSEQMGYIQEECIDYDEVFAPVTRIEAIRLFLTYASFKDFVVYQMNVNSAFLYEKIKEEVYVRQPLGFEDPDFPDKVYKVKKALYGLRQSPRACKGFSSKETPLFLRMVRPNQVQMSEGLAQPTNTQRTPTFDMPPLKPKKTQKPRQPKRKTTKVPQSSESTDITADEVVHKEGVTVCSGDGPRRQDTMGDTSAHTRYERVSKISSDSLLTGVNTPQIDENRLKHFELMKIYTILQKKVLDLGDELKRTKTAQQTKIDGLKRRVKKLEKKQRLRTHKLKRLYKVGFTTRVISSSDEALDKEDTSKQGSVDEIDTDENIALVITHDDMIIDVVVDVAQVTIAIADIPVSATETIVTTTLTINAESTTTNVEVTQAPKRKGDMIQEPEETTITKIASLQKPQVQDKDKAMKRIDTFVDFRTELVEESRKKDEAETTQESSSKKEGDELEQDRSKKQKVEDDKESEELKKCLEIILDDVTIDAIPLSSKSPTIVDYKIYTEGKKNYSKFSEQMTSRQVEMTNRGLKCILERTVGENCALWSDKLEDALWAFLTAYKTLIYCTPYRHVYGKACHLPHEIEHKAYWALKHTNFDLTTAGDHRKLQINELSELHDQAYENSLIYKERTKKLHDDKIKNRIFNVGDQVLLIRDSRYSRSIVGDLSTIMEATYHRWRSRMLLLSLRTTEFRDRVEPTTQIILPKFEDFLCKILSWFSRPLYPF